MIRIYVKRMTEADIESAIDAFTLALTCVDRNVAPTLYASIIRALDFLMDEAIDRDRAKYANLLAVPEETC